LSAVLDDNLPGRSVSDAKRNLRADELQERIHPPHDDAVRLVFAKCTWAATSPPAVNKIASKLSPPPMGSMLPIKTI
jgi:hypothetical protein